MPTERPLLVSGPLIGPILRGEKTVTRRLGKFRAESDRAQVSAPRQIQGGKWIQSVYAGDEWWFDDTIRPPCAVGDVLWVRETWRPWIRGFSSHVQYRADDRRGPSLGPEASNAAMTWCETRGGHWDDGRAANPADAPWFPSIHMPRWAARIFLRVESVTVERLQDINVDDIVSEGVLTPAEVEEGCALPVGEIQAYMRPKFAAVWDSLAPAGSKWADNPWAWRIAFKLEVSRG